MMTDRLAPKLWVVIADGEHARVVTPSAPHGQFKTVLSFDSASAHMSSRDLGTDRPGRVHESASTTRHAITPRQDPHQAAKRDFMQEVARQIDINAGEFDRLVLVAPGHALHDLRGALGNVTSAKLAGSLVKDLTKISDHDLVSHLAQWWQRPTEEAA
jgi:protein required for attachment to host cells